ncbi:hypothetical protein M0813_28765 [Anaeramoeba flamelloides]|uniref:Uncharacterized protein n=1 Tax=Anaeramoeba flamelloides TaxID=1746091 RepID=A0ABQ8XU63_9EUKA|nr:hypothetical protein M0813_28765 [Anaeramoeba flamelloides]
MEQTKTNTVLPGTLSNINQKAINFLLNNKQLTVLKLKEHLEEEFNEETITLIKKHYSSMIKFLSRDPFVILNSQEGLDSIITYKQCSCQNEKNENEDNEEDEDNKSITQKEKNMKNSLISFFDENSDWKKQNNLISLIELYLFKNNSLSIMKIEDFLKKEKGMKKETEKEKEKENEEEKEKKKEKEKENEKEKKIEKDIENENEKEKESYLSNILKEWGSFADYLFVIGKNSFVFDQENIYLTKIRKEEIEKQETFKSEHQDLLSDIKKERENEKLTIKKQFAEIQKQQQSIETTLLKAYTTIEGQANTIKQLEFILAKLEKKENISNQNLSTQFTEFEKQELEKNIEELKQGMKLLNIVPKKN